MAHSDRVHHRSVKLGLVEQPRHVQRRPIDDCSPTQSPQVRRLRPPSERVKRLKMLDVDRERRVAAALSLPDHSGLVITGTGCAWVSAW